MTPNTTIEITQGVDFHVSFGPEDAGELDLTGATARCQIRTDSAGDLVFDFASAETPIYVDPTDLRVHLVLDKIETRKLAPASHRFDVLVDLASGVTVKIAKGSAIIEGTGTQ